MPLSDDYGRERCGWMVWSGASWVLHYLRGPGRELVTRDVGGRDHGPVSRQYAERDALAWLRRQEGEQ